MKAWKDDQIIRKISDAIAETDDTVTTLSRLDCQDCSGVQYTERIERQSLMDGCLLLDYVQDIERNRDL